MFGFNKKTPMIEGPVEFEMEIDIERSFVDVFSLIDIADPSFHLAQQGVEIQPTDGGGGVYTATWEELGDVKFIFHVLERVEGQRHSMECVMEPQTYGLEKSVETYEIVPVGDTDCRVKLTTSATFDATLSDEETAAEIATMSEAVSRDLTKLKLLAEEGIEAVKAFDEAELCVELDLGDFDIDWDEIEPEQ